MQTIKSSIVLVIILLLLSSCSAVDEHDEQVIVNFLDSSNENERVYFFDDNAEKLFADLFQLVDNFTHSVYIVDNNLNISIEFDNSATKEDISNARRYFMRYAVLVDNTFSGFPYQEVHEKRIQYDFANLRIFIDDDLVLYEKYSKNPNEFTYYENTTTNILDRNFKNEHVERLINSVKRQVKKCRDIKSIKPLKGNVILLKISTKGKLENNEIELIKNLIASDSAVQLESEQVQKYGINTKYLGIAIELSTENEKYAEYTYFNGRDKRWIDESWMNYDFFKANNQN